MGRLGRWGEPIENLPLNALSPRAPAQQAFASPSRTTRVPRVWPQVPMAGLYRRRIGGAVGTFPQNHPKISLRFLSVTCGGSSPD
jgi:hypothetical protein